MNMQQWSKALLLVLLLVTAGMASVTPYVTTTTAIVHEGLSPYNQDELCLGKSDADKVCLNRVDFKLFQDKRLTANQLCLGEGTSRVCLDSSDIQKLKTPSDTLTAKRICTGNMCWEGDDNGMIMRSMDGKQTLVRFDKGWDKLQVYTNSDNKAPYFYVNQGMNSGVHRG